MTPAQFKKLLSELEHLTDTQVRRVETFLKGDDAVQSIITELEQRMVDTPECPHCHSSLINRHGKLAACRDIVVRTALRHLPRQRIRHWPD